MKSITFNPLKNTYIYIYRERERHIPYPYKASFAENISAREAFFYFPKINII